MKLLYIDACARHDSRTRKLAEHLIGRTDAEVTRVYLYDRTWAATDEKVLKMRDAAKAAGDYSDAYFDNAKQFAAADEIVIASPFWDLSFPAVLKAYLETVCVCGITFRYSPEGIPIGLCRAKKLTYVTTAGGTIYDDSFGYGYVKALALSLFGIGQIECVKAEGLDIVGADAEEILRGAMDTLNT